MTTPPDPSHPVAPTVAEIAALTARLRDISGRGRDVDPAERAQFLADKDTLIARIIATDTAITDSPFNATGRAHTDAAGRDGPGMPQWMRRQARETEAATADGTAPERPTDDRDALAERITEQSAAPHEQGSGAPTTQESVDAAERAFDELCERYPLPGEGPGEWASDRRTGAHWWIDDDYDTDTDVSDEIATANPHIWDAPSPPTEHHHGPGRAGEQERREQLARWHAEDHPADATDAEGTERTNCCVDYAALARGEDQ